VWLYGFRELLWVQSEVWLRSRIERVWVDAMMRQRRICWHIRHVLSVRGNRKMSIGTVVTEERLLLHALRIFKEALKTSWVRMLVVRRHDILVSLDERMLVDV